MPESKIIINMLTPSLNKFLRTHFMKRYWLKDQFMWLLKIAGSGSIDEAGEREKRKIKLISYRKSFLDKDNFIGGCQPLINALKGLRLIYDDSSEFLDLETEQVIEKKRNNWRTEIIISTPKKRGKA